MPDLTSWLGRKRRIAGRVLNQKKLPEYTYRWDARSPQEIARDGFGPWNEGGDVTLIDHVNGSYSSGPSRGRATKYDSQFVSTGAYGMIKNPDPLLAQGMLAKTLYKIRTGVAGATGPFRDVNDEFDRAGIERPFSTQREWLKEGRIPPAAIVGYMTGRYFFDTYMSVQRIPAQESQLSGWLPMPPPLPA
ncbi:hypothetical protein AA23498_3498 [Acetobacter nitrogenifigens DSM 23921 = NBRC 105050]|uniref:Uncharacterized protein n=1 Tax=Acetobacter nitrogenifigens DSM 23921 = NBRC 105050 TaxID=1120919 RepID=A0A511XEH5_9PROT|nr:hypothetical protein [Acetobacter nitrogenifigens]GBQ99572.1 hypothetical protein AA23498_3498 [Acetobacter nitrogenifigens DSM 23921 = NBRC 105050]GEN61362.1 hypothetical protein ANI02nite_32460 [Acetobacter nitrogenifigens DSM 23921 = NBRC 105050]